VAGAALTACAAIAGVSDYSQGTSTDASLSGDVRVPDSGHADAASQPDGTSPVDTGSSTDDATVPGPDVLVEPDAPGDLDTGATEDGSASAEASDDGAAATDAADDGAASSDGEVPDAGPPDSGPPDTGPTCSSTHTVLNCSACGVACDTTTGTPSCNGTRCSYACKQGSSDCNYLTAPNTDGCECATPACCSGGACETTHSDGVGQTFYDCVASKTYTQAQAQAACIAYTGNGLFCVVPSPAFCLAQTNSVCSNVPGASTWYCWEYAGPSPGTVQKALLANSVACPASGDPSWN
jgi:hypothetical protein